MTSQADQDVTQVLAAAAGDEAASQHLLPLVYGELRKLAASMMARTPPGNTLQPTVLGPETYWQCDEHGEERRS